MRANASKRKAMSYERMGKEAARLQAEIEALLTKAGMVDAEEDGVGARISGATSCPRSCNAGRSAWRRQAAKARLEAAQRGATMSAGASLGRTAIPGAGGPTSGPTASPSRSAEQFHRSREPDLKTSSEGFQQCYNAQMAVDGEHQIIVATQVGPQASDQGQLVGMLDEINETRSSLRWLADAGYCNSRICWSWDRGIDRT